MIVYISGPVTGVDNFEEAFQKATNAVEGKGHTVVSPLSCGVLKEEIYGWSDCMKVCIALMERCNGIVMLDGWRTSVGARIEKLWAEKVGLNIYYGVDELPPF